MNTVTETTGHDLPSIDHINVDCCFSKPQAVFYRIQTTRGICISRL